MTTEHALVTLAQEAATPSALREDALGLLCEDLNADLGIFVAVEAGREVRTLHGVEGSQRVVVEASWRRSAEDLSAVKARAILDGATTDRRVLGAALERTVLYRRVMAPFGGTETLVLVPTVAGRPLGMIALGRRGGRFSEAALAHARSLVPVLSLACRVASAPRDNCPAVTTSESDLLDYLELGLSTEQIAEARGTSFFTVRNQLAALYRKLGVSNRAEAVGRRYGRQ
jgi:DNA-binding CsgD family transcriptional regulator